MQRVLVELVGAAEEIVEQRVLALEVAHEQRLGELALVLEVVEEAALGDADGGDQLLDRGAGKALLEHGRLGDVEKALARVAALALLGLLHAGTPADDCTTGTVDALVAAVASAELAKTRAVRHFCQT